MFSGDSIDRVEVVAQFSGQTLKNLFLSPSGLTPGLQQFAENLSDLTGFEPTISLDVGNREPARWQAEFVRFSDSVDTSARTFGVVVAIDDPLSKVVPGIRPPLSKGMFVDVSIAGRVQPDRIAVPRNAIRNDQAYILNDASRLEIRTVQRLYDQGDQTVIASGLETGDRLTR